MTEDGTDLPTTNGGRNNSRLVNAPAAYQALVNNSAALNIEITFRLWDSILAAKGAALVGADAEATRLLVCEYCALHPEVPWYSHIRRHYVEVLGR